MDCKAGSVRSKVTPTVREDRVLGDLRNMSIHKSMGHDEMHPIVLRELADAIAKTLSMTLGKSWQSGEVPGEWKMGNIVPIFKKGRKKDPGNYCVPSQPPVHCQPARWRVGVRSRKGLYCVSTAQQ